MYTSSSTSAVTNSTPSVRIPPVNAVGPVRMTSTGSAMPTMVGYSSTPIPIHSCLSGRTIASARSRHPQPGGLGVGVFEMLCGAFLLRRQPRALLFDPLRSLVRDRSDEGRRRDLQPAHQPLAEARGRKLRLQIGKTLVLTLLCAHLGHSLERSVPYCWSPRRGQVDLEVNTGTFPGRVLPVLRTAHRGRREFPIEQCAGPGELLGRVPQVW